MRSCRLTLKDVEGKAITTIEGIAANHPVEAGVDIGGGLRLLSARADTSSSL